MLHFLHGEKRHYLDGRDRVVTFEVKKWIYRKSASPFKWRLLKFSSTHPIMSDSAVLKELFAKEHGHECSVISNIEPFKKLGIIHTRVRKVVQRSKHAKSFVFESTDGQSFEYMSGMWATFTLDIDGERYMRNWTLSSGNCTLLEGIPISSEEFKSDKFEITVKKTRGQTSPWLHDNVRQGSEIMLNGVEGTFTLNASRRILLRDLSAGRIGGANPFHKEHASVQRRKQKLLDTPGHKWWKILYVSAGIGVTPIVGMLRSLEIMCHKRGIMTPDQLPDISFVHSESTMDDIPFSKVFQRLLESGSKGDKAVIDRMAFVLTRESSEKKDELLKQLRHTIGRSETDASIQSLTGERLTRDFLESFVPDIAERFVYLCGPPQFMESIKKHLVSLRVPLEHILTENFAD